LEIARQLTLIEFEYYDKLVPTELLGQAWSKRFQSAPNVISMIQRYTAVSHWITSLIVEPARVKIRAKRYSKLVKVAERLKALNNFSTLMAFLAGFNSSSVIRLKFTRQLLPKKAQEVLIDMERLMSPEGSSKCLRDALRGCIPPCIPYIGIYLQDLTFIDDGNPDTVGNLINFGKRMLTYKVISEIQRFQQVGYPLITVQGIAKLVRDIPTREEKSYGKQLYEMSLSREPRDAEKVP